MASKMSAATETKLSKASAAFREHVTGAMPCPNCGSKHDRHEDNGQPPTSYTYTLLCLDCEHQWSPNEG